MGLKNKPWRRVGQSPKDLEIKQKTDPGDAPQQPGMVSEQF